MTFLILQWNIKEDILKNPLRYFSKYVLFEPETFRNVMRVSKTTKEKVQMSKKKMNLAWVKCRLQKHPVKEDTMFFKMFSFYISPQWTSGLEFCETSVTCPGPLQTMTKQPGCFWNSVFAFEESRSPSVMVNQM